jgi:CrcB protein
MQLILLTVFGAIGTLSRYGLQGWVQFQSGAAFPAGTLAVNLLGCVLIGGMNRLAFEHLWLPPEWRVALTIGLLGSFTTFSACWKMANGFTPRFMSSSASWGGWREWSPE